MSGSSRVSISSQSDRSEYGFSMIDTGQVNQIVGTITSTCRTSLP